jgi:hypothetical protein
MFAANYGANTDRQKYATIFIAASARICCARATFYTKLQRFSAFQQRLKGNAGLAKR